VRAASIFDRTFIGLSNFVLGNRRTRTVPWASLATAVTPMAGSGGGGVRDVLPVSRESRNPVHVLPTGAGGNGGGGSGSRDMALVINAMAATSDDGGHESGGEESKGMGPASPTAGNGLRTRTSRRATANRMSRMGSLMSRVFDASGVAQPMEGWSRIHYLQAGEHIEVQGMVSGEALERFYTPVPYPSDPSLLQLVVKVYPRGAMSNWLRTRSKDDYIKIRGSMGKPLLTQWAHDAAHQRPLTPVIMFAAGSGVTPFPAFVLELLALEARATAAASASESVTPVVARLHPPLQLLLVVFDRTPADAMLVDELDELVRVARGRLTVRRSFDNAQTEVQAAPGQVQVPSAAAARVSHPGTTTAAFKGRISSDIVLQCLQLMDGQPLPLPVQQPQRPVQPQFAVSSPSRRQSSALQRGQVTPVSLQQLAAAMPSPLDLPLAALSSSVSALVALSNPVTATVAAAALPHPPSSPPDALAMTSSPADTVVSVMDSRLPPLSPSAGLPPRHRKLSFGPQSVGNSGGGGGGGGEGWAVRRPSLGGSPSAGHTAPATSSGGGGNGSPRSSASASAGPLAGIRSLPRVFVCGPLDFLRTTLAALDEIKFDMKRVDCL
jgi:ferredoxin-NADP reductase